VKLDRRLSDLYGRPIGGSLPYWRHEVTENFFFLWHTGSAIPLPNALNLGYQIGLSCVDWMAMCSKMWHYHITENTGCRPRFIPIVTRLACEKMAGMQ
jgi:hypothetical protein